MALHGKPTMGRKLPFYAPLPASKRLAAEYGNTTDGTFARVLCKDSIGNFLKLPRAGYRTSSFEDQPPTGDAGNAGKNFIINEKIGAKHYKFELLPGTTVQMGQYDYNLTSFAPVDVPMRSIDLWVPGHIQTWRVLYWISNQVKFYVRDDDTNSPPLPNYEDIEPLGKIISVVTPNERKYNVRSILFPNAVPVVPPGTVAPPSPSPTPTPTPTP